MAKKTKQEAQQERLSLAEKRNRQERRNKKSRKEREQEKRRKKQERDRRKQKNIPTTAQQSIPYIRMLQDGICQVTKTFFSKTIQFYDINYQLALNEDKTTIFENYCDFLNYFDSSISVQLSFINQQVDVAEFEKSIDIPDQNDDFNAIREEYRTMLKNQLSKGNNGLVKTKYITFGIEAENLKVARPRLERIETDILNNFKVLGAQAHSLNGLERLEILYHVFNQDRIEPFKFQYKMLPETGLKTKDFIAPTSFNFSKNQTFLMGRTMGSVSYLQILAPELTDRISYTKEEYRKQLAFFLPPAMIPSEFVNVERFPLSTNGKIDRKGLAESIQKNIKVKHNAKATLISQKKEYVELAKSIKKIVCSISGNDYIDYEDNLLENGLDSLLLSQISGRIVSDIQEAQGMRFDEILRASLTMPTIMGIAQYISDCKNPSKNQMHSNAGNQTRNSYTVVYIFGDNENEIRDVLIEKLSASNISCKRVGGQEIIERCHEDISVKKKYIIAFSEMASLCITKASELLGENIIINRIFLINPSKAKESDLYLGDISIIDGNSVAIKSWESL